MENTSNDTAKHSSILSLAVSDVNTAVWTNDATLALLALYEANMYMLDHPKKKNKNMASYHVITASKMENECLNKRYKECIDSNNKTGRGAVEFQWFDQLDEFSGKTKKKQSANKQVIEDVTATMQPETLKKLRPAHGTASNIAKSKIELGKQWHQYLQDKAKREVKEKNGTTT
ncbi:hypothetical protein P5V15_015596 [Pogonomyrmex californicus]